MAMSLFMELIISIKRSKLETYHNFVILLNQVIKIIVFTYYIGVEEILNKFMLNKENEVVPDDKY